MAVLLWVLTGLAGLIVFDLLALGAWMLFVMSRERRQRRGELIIVSYASSYCEDRAIARARVMLQSG